MKSLNYASAIFFGDTPDEKDKGIENFQNPDHTTRFFVGNPATAGYGLTLTQANLAEHLCE